MTWTYRYRGIDDAGLDDRYDKPGYYVSEPRQWTVAEIALIREWRKRKNETPKTKEVEALPVRGMFDNVNGFYYYIDKVVDVGMVGNRCYLTVNVMDGVHNVHVPDTPEWSWLKQAVVKYEGGDKNKKAQNSTGILQDD